MKKDNPMVKITDHALIRYIERVLEISLDPIRKQMLNSGVVDTYKSIGDGKYPVKDCIMVVKEGNITTTFKVNKRSNKRHKRNGQYSRKHHERKFGNIKRSSDED